jgi:NOL1/NOP2/fmu family ribosome biogenesis protein
VEKRRTTMVNYTIASSFPLLIVAVRGNEKGKSDKKRQGISLGLFKASKYRLEASQAIVCGCNYCKSR